MKHESESQNRTNDHPSYLNGREDLASLSIGTGALADEIYLQDMSDIIAQIRLTKEEMNSLGSVVGVLNQQIDGLTKSYEGKKSESEELDRELVDLDIYRNIETLTIKSPDFNHIVEEIRPSFSIGPNMVCKFRLSNNFTIIRNGTNVFEQSDVSYDHPRIGYRKWTIYEFQKGWRFIKEIEGNKNIDIEYDELGVPQNTQEKWEVFDWLVGERNQVKPIMIIDGVDVTREQYDKECSECYPQSDKPHITLGKMVFKEYQLEGYRYKDSNGIDNFLLTSIEIPPDSNSPDLGKRIYEDLVKYLFFGERMGEIPYNTSILDFFENIDSILEDRNSYLNWVRMNYHIGDIERFPSEESEYERAIGREPSYRLIIKNYAILEMVHGLPRSDLPKFTPHLIAVEVLRKRDPDEPTSEETNLSWEIKQMKPYLELV